jgi:hypothetical protein
MILTTAIPHREVPVRIFLREVQTSENSGHGHGTAIVIEAQLEDSHTSYAVGVFWPDGTFTRIGGLPPRMGFKLDPHKEIRLALEKDQK